MRNETPMKSNKNEINQSGFKKRKSMAQSTAKKDKSSNKKYKQTVKRVSSKPSALGTIEVVKKDIKDNVELTNETPKPKPIDINKTQSTPNLMQSINSIEKSAEQDNPKPITEHKFDKLEGSSLKIKRKINNASASSKLPGSVTNNDALGRNPALTRFDKKFNHVNPPEVGIGQGIQRGNSLRSSLNIIPKIKQVSQQQLNLR